MDKENIKLGLLGVIALTLVINTYYMATSKRSYATPAPTEETSSKATSDIPLAGGPAMPSTPRNTITSDPINNATTTPNATDNNSKPTSISFAKYEHNYGTVMQETANKTEFVFTNTGKEPLIISNAQGSCGCTVPNFPKEPIMPGKTGKIDVEFKPAKGQVGTQEKTVTVTANTEPAQTILKIKAEVK